MSFLNQNLEIIEKRFKPLFSLLNKTAINCELKSETARDGNLTLQSNMKYIHSRYRPIEEAQRIIEKQINGNENGLIFYGLGLGYLPLLWLQNHQRGSTGPYIIIIEPDTFLLKSLLAIKDFSPLLNYHQLIILTQCQPAAILSALGHIDSPSLKTIISTPLIQGREDYFKEMDAKISHYIESWEVNLNTHRKFGPIWNRHIFKCINRIIDQKREIYPVSTLFNSLDKIPALVIAAGPSLNSQAEAIHQFKKEGILIAVDTAMPFLNANQIEPDFLVTSDTQYYNSRHLDYTDLSNIRVISELTVHPSLFSRKMKSCFLYSSPIPLYQAIESIYSSFGDLGTGGSVATTAWDFARKCGCSPIITSGLDLGYPDNETHAKESRFETLILHQNKRLLPIDNFNSATIYNDQRVIDKNYRGEALATDARMIVYRNWFRQQIENYPGNYYCSTDSGLKIKGFRTLRELAHFHKVLEKSPINRYSDIECKIDSREKKKLLLPFFNPLLQLRRKLNQSAITLQANHFRYQPNHSLAPFFRLLTLEKHSLIDDPRVSEEEKSTAINEAIETIIQSVL